VAGESEGEEGELTIHKSGTGGVRPNGAASRFFNCFLCLAIATSHCID
jgi:hypothetical protein